MNNRHMPYILVVLLLLNSGFESAAQCGYGGTAFTSQNANAMTYNTIYTPSTCYYGGEYMPLTNVVAGEAFEVWAGSAFDSQLTVFQEGSATALAYNDDSGPLQANVYASLRFIAPASGSYRILLSRYNCTTQSTCNSINIRKVHPWGGPSNVSGSGACNGINMTCAFQNGNAGSGTYTYFYANSGSEYSFSTCPTTMFDTHITIYAHDGSVWRPIFYNNDSGPICATIYGSVTFTAPVRPNQCNFLAVVNRAGNQQNCIGKQVWQYHDFTGQSAIIQYRKNQIGANTTWQGGFAGADNWKDIKNWNNCVPTLSINAIIPNVGQQPGINTTGAQCKTLDIATGRVLTICTGCLTEFGNP
ncbi:MAG: hypothetical protein K9J06_06180 [Flavobacteriales bacterium]|nr:hypothetical protein [Flavobacteriales bacterium]